MVFTGDNVIGASYLKFSVDVQGSVSRNGFAQEEVFSECVHSKVMRGRV